MKIWKEFGSSHSADITIVGEFENQKDAAIALPMIQDLIFGHENGIKDMKEFHEKWKNNLNVHGLYLYNHEFNDDPDVTANIDINGENLTVKGYRSSIFEGIIKIMFMCKSKNIQITGTPTY